MSVDVQILVTNKAMSFLVVFSNVSYDTDFEI